MGARHVLGETALTVVVAQPNQAICTVPSQAAGTVRSACPYMYTVHVHCAVHAAVQCHWRCKVYALSDFQAQAVAASRSCHQHC
jgi:hypothetical protein